MLTAAELAAMQDVEESVLVTTAHILSYGTATDGMGGYSETWGTVGTVLCDLWQINQRADREMVAGNQITSQGDFFITMPSDTTITAKDRVQIAGKTFEVTFVPDDLTFQTAVRVEARLFNQERRT
jgi:SPP1 family predicted phage head-tail adaptor